VEVHQATGMIVAQAQVSPPEAVDLLVEYAHATDRSVQETAVEVVERRLHFGDG
jgi:hypothetical protein